MSKLHNISATTRMLEECNINSKSAIDRDELLLSMHDDYKAKPLKKSPPKDEIKEKRPPPSWAEKRNIFSDGNELPFTVHEAKEVPGRVIIFGDVHGCLTELKNLISKCEYNPSSDLLICVGDLVNKGPDSIGVLRYMSELQILSVLGNHDYSCLMLVNELQNGLKYDPDSDDPLHHIANELLDPLNIKLLEYLRSLPLFISVPKYHIGVVHAGVIPGIPIMKQRGNVLLHVRHIRKYPSWNPILKKSEGRWQINHFFSQNAEPWAKHYQGPIKLLFGHDSRRGFQQYEFAIGLDTGCVYGNSLTALVYPGERLISVPGYGAKKNKTKNKKGNLDTTESFIEGETIEDDSNSETPMDLSTFQLHPQNEYNKKRESSRDSEKIPIKNILHQSGLGVQRDLCGKYLNGIEKSSYCINSSGGSDIKKLNKIYHPPSIPFKGEFTSEMRTIHELTDSLNSLSFPIDIKENEAESDKSYQFHMATLQELLTPPIAEYGGIFSLIHLLKLREYDVMWRISLPNAMAIESGREYKLWCDIFEALCEFVIHPTPNFPQVHATVKDALCHICECVTQYDEYVFKYFDIIKKVLEVSKDIPEFSVFRNDLVSYINKN